MPLSATKQSGKEEADDADMLLSLEVSVDETENALPKEVTPAEDPPDRG